jgi:vancomycin resistance protein YoaR
MFRNLVFKNPMRAYVSLQQNWRRGQNRFCLKVKGIGKEREEGEEMPKQCLPI